MGEVRRGGRGVTGDILYVYLSCLGEGVMEKFVQHPLKCESEFEIGIVSCFKATISTDFCQIMEKERRFSV
jgi:hypothetical protein